jgi:citrate synthase
MRRVPWKSNITKVFNNKLETHGIPQEHIIETFSYEEMVLLLILGRRPTQSEKDRFRWVILSHCSHGITGQSTLAVRMAADCRSRLLDSVLAGFLVGSGPYHQGGLEASMEELIRAVRSGDVCTYVQEKLSNRQIVYGFGHRFHRQDPRAGILIRLCVDQGAVGKYVEAVQEMDRVIHRSKGIRMNIEAACAAILLDIGFPPNAAPLIILLGRAPMLAAAFMERLQSGARPFQKIAVYDMVGTNEKQL